MTEKEITKNRQAMIADIVNEQMDMLAFAEKYNLSPDELAAWVTESETRQCLSTLCLLADLQTQLLLSRYRSLAANKLIRLATDDENNSDTARKACVDLLKLDLKRADLDGSNLEGSQNNRHSDAVQQLRKLLYETGNDQSGDMNNE